MENVYPFNGIPKGKDHFPFPQVLCLRLMSWTHLSHESIIYTVWLIGILTLADFLKCNPYVYSPYIPQTTRLFFPLLTCIHFSCGSNSKLKALHKIDKTETSATTYLHTYFCSAGLRVEISQNFLLRPKIFFCRFGVFQWAIPILKPYQSCLTRKFWFPETLWKAKCPGKKLELYEQLLSTCFWAGWDRVRLPIFVPMLNPQSLKKRCWSIKWKDIEQCPFRFACASFYAPLLNWRCFSRIANLFLTLNNFLITWSFPNLQWHIVPYCFRNSSAKGELTPMDLQFSWSKFLRNMAGCQVGRGRRLRHVQIRRMKFSCRRCHISY